MQRNTLYISWGKLGHVWCVGVRHLPLPPIRVDGIMNAYLPVRVVYGCASAVSGA